MEREPARPPVPSPEALAAKLAQLPDRWLPALYFGAAHLCLLLALAAVAGRPDAFVGSPYGAWLLAVVHLVTVGWITGSILGALYLVPPMALRRRVSRRPADFAAFACWALGTAGLVAHFAIGELSGVAWSGSVVLLAVAIAAGRALAVAVRAPVPRAIRAAFLLAGANFALAVALGVLQAADHLHPFLPWPFFGRVYAHAHLAAVGWALLMVMAAGYRLLPMLLPAAMPSGPVVWASVAAVEAGVLLLAVGLLAGSTMAVVAGAAGLAAAVALFLSVLGWMLRNRRPAPPERPRPDWALAHVASAVVCLAAATACGLALALLPPPAPPGLALAYGALGLVGFLAQMVVGVGQRLAGWLAWMWGYALAGYQEIPPRPERLPARRLGAAVFLLWAAGLPLLVAGLGATSPGAVAVGAVALLLATAANLAQQARILRRAFGRPRIP